jgi:hypothetical protein
LKTHEEDYVVGDSQARLPASVKSEIRHLRQPAGLFTEWNVSTTLKQAGSVFTLNSVTAAAGLSVTA